MSPEVISYLTPISMLLFFILGMFFFLTWSRDRRDRLRFDHEMKSKELELQERQQADVEYERYEEERRSKDASFQPSGYILFDLDDKHRSTFVDLLKGFEEYALLKGYSVAFSFDSSIPNKIAFKFTILNEGVTVSPRKVKEDLEEYIEKIKTGEPLDDLPVVIDSDQHALLLAAFKNRINFLQFNYNLAQNHLDYFQALLAAANPIIQSNVIQVQSGAKLDQRSYTASNSPQALMGGDGSKIHQEHETEIKIAITFKERQSQIDNLTRLIEALQNESKVDEVKKEQTIRYFEKVKEELVDEEEPDPTRIRKWFTRAKEALETLHLGKDTVELLKTAYISFNAVDLLSNLPFI